MKIFRYKITLSLVLMLAGSAATFAKMNVGANRLASVPNTGAKTAAACPVTQAQIDLDVNQVRARVLVGGDLWWDPFGQTPYYEVPIGSNKNALYSGALWIGGFDQSNQLLVAAQTYRQQGANDFWGGPISRDNGTGAISITDARCLEFDKFWTIKREDVENFLANGVTTPDIESWPGNGNVANGELPFLAPYFDANNDGTYNHEDGDYPYFKLDGDYPTDPNTNETVCNDYIFGDESIWWVFNDVGNSKTETNSNPIGLEIRAQAFAFNTTNDVNFMTFYKYQVINRSSNELDSTYFGVWCDPDLGNASDDYVGCDVGLGLGYCYNGDPDDDGGGGYGLNPPAVGIDFFQGPLADLNDGVDNNKDGRVDEPGEQITMSRFVYYENVNNVPNGNPAVTDDYYEYLSGSWLDGAPITYGGNGKGIGPGATTTPCEYMFPGTTDPKFSTPWTMVTAGIQPTDMRWLQSAGIFTLQPGAVNYITTGVVWGRATAGGPLASVEVIKRSDDLAQRLFNNCFQVLDGPDAPEVAIREMDQQIILSLENTRNDKVELYSQFDKNIPGVIADQINDSTIVYDTLSIEERSYKFQGYKVYQVSDENVSISDISDPAKAKLLAQIDLEDDVTKLVNYSFDNNLQAFIPSQKTDDINAGITHNFIITQDQFTLKPLANYSPYYFMVISYASNNYRTFNAFSPDPVQTQAEPYLQGRKNVKIYSAIPHKPVVNNGGTVMNAAFGDGFKIKRIEGTGNGGNVLDLTSETVAEILGSADNRAVNPVYEAGLGPIDVSIYDPLKVKGGGFRVRFNGVADDSRYFIENNPAGTLIDSSLFTLSNPYEQLLENNKIAFNIFKITGQEPGDGSDENGFLEATLTYSNPAKPWLTGVADVDGSPTRDWILSGTESTDLASAGIPLDRNSIYEGVLEGTWAPYKMVARAAVGAPKLNSSIVDVLSKWTSLASVDVVFTADKNKWTRCSVVETGEDTMPNIGAAKKFDKRRSPSVDKNGVAGDGVVSTDPNDADFVSATGMGWFPGYAINVETGERLNIAFGENSSLVGENSQDMIWNPTSNIGTDANGRLAFGGMHYIYIFNKNGVLATDIPIYDNGVRVDSLLNTLNAVAKRNVFKDCIWTSLPLALGGNPLLATDAKVRLRVAKNYRTFTSSNTAQVNGGNPLYEFDIPQSSVASTGQTEAAKDALDLIRVVPNPYYAYSTYEKTRKDQLDNRVRVTNLPSKCTVSIYTINGTLIRQFKRDFQSDVSDGLAVVEGQDFNQATTLDWDLKNTAGITVASGVYIIHVDAGYLGEKVVKWFGVMRPIDLDSF
ncbi:MAG: hypothetical protein IPN36_08140 [Bacteroidetes bacterium]|nr:hypothetical protein [Bacteroidota bacterium]